MRKCILALAALLSLTSAASAHIVPPVPFVEIGSLRDVHQAAFAIFQTYAGPPQIFYNIVSDGGANCSGPATAVSRTFDINHTTKVLTTTVDTFASGDVGKAIILPQAGFGTETWTTTIASFTDARNVVLTATFKNVSGSTQTIAFGFDASPNFKTFNTWARANQGSSNQVVLAIPNGSHCWFGTTQAITGLLINSYFGGINNLIVEGTGATIDATNGSGFFLGAQGQYEVGLTNVNGKSARLQTVSAGSTSVQLTAASLAAGYISRFTVGNTIMVSGLDLQTGWQQNYGVPSNHQFFDWPKITAIDAGTGVISLDRPLTNDYLDTWPEYYNGSSGGLDQGGPATAYAINPLWDATIEYRGLTIVAGQSYVAVRNVTFRNVTWTGCCGTVPSQNETFAVYDSLFDTYASPGWEVDKLIGTVIFDNSTVKRIDFQSSSTNRLVMTNSSITTAMFGTPKNAQITDTFFNLFRPGAWTNGASTGSLVCTRCDVTDFQFNGGLNQNFASSVFAMSGGVITVANVDNTGANGPPHRLFVPGNNIYLTTTGYASVGLLQTTTQTQDATNVYTQTNDAGGFPGLAGYTPQWIVHPAPQFTCDACTGDPELVATNIQSGATPLAPLGEYSSRENLTLGTPFVTAATLQVRGKISSLTINVTTAYNGTGSATMFAAAPFGLTTIKQSDWTTFSWHPQINLKQVGERVLTPSGVTCDGVAAPTGCSGDNLGTALPEAVWIQNGLGVGLGTSLSAGTTPVVTITARTDQGVVP